MGDSSDNEEYEITDLVHQFMAVTGAEDTMALSYLQQSSWNVESAINKFFDSLFTRGGHGSKENPVLVSDHSGQVASSSGNGSMESQGQAEETNPNLTVLSWNVDGLDKRHLLERTRKVCHIINSLKPDAVFLQEVIPESLSIFESTCSGYSCKYGPTHAYFNILLLKNLSIKTTDDLHCTYFQSSKMGRHMLCQPVMYKNKTELILMTSHLESTAQCKGERKRQFEQVLTNITEQPPQATVIFGGDTNLRDAEVSSIGGLPSGVVDAWKECGRPADSQYTWDTSINDNLDWAYPRKPRIRFDRLFVRSAQGTHALKATKMSLVGMERLAGCRRFPSDHWGVWCEFSQPSNETKPAQKKRKLK